MQSLSFSPDNAWLATGGNEDELFIWSLRDRSIIKSYKTPNHKGGVLYDVGWSHDGRILAGGNNERLVFIDVRFLSST